MSAAAIIGTTSGIVGWLVTAQVVEGSISIATTELNPPLLAGNCISVGLSLVLTVGISLIWREPKFDWNLLKEKITAADETVRPNQGNQTFKTFFRAC